MEGEEGIAEQYSFPVSVGERLRLARIEKSLSLADVATETRISERHLTLLEEGDFGSLPGRTYAVGFSRSYAKFVGLDENEVARDVRTELSFIDGGDQARAGAFEPGDPARVPSARLAWLSAFAGLAIFATGSYFMWTSFVAPAGELPWLTRDEPAVSSAQKQAVASPAAPRAVSRGQSSGQVVFTATEEGIWVKFYDSTGSQLMQKQMSLGESYAIPASADGPQIWTGRPDALSITVGGDPVPRLADTVGIIKDVPVTAEALMARETQPASVSPTA
jgi:transcriptional regulator with XRE-family HTH domain